MKNLLLPFLFLLFISLDGTAQLKNSYTNGTVYFLNGDIYDCKIAFPILNRSNNLGITMRSKNDIVAKNLKDEKEKIDNEEIDYIVFEGEQGYFKLVWTYAYEIRGAYKKKLSKYKSWYLLNNGCEEVASYAWADKFDLNKDGEVVAIYIGQLGFFGNYYLWRPNEDYPSYICSMTEGNGIGYKKYRKKYLKTILKEIVMQNNFWKGRKTLRFKKSKTILKIDVPETKLIF